MCVVGQSSLDNPDMFPGEESLTVRITTRHCAGFSSSGFSELLQSVDLCLSLLLEILGGCIFEYFFSPFSRFVGSSQPWMLCSAPATPTWVEATDEPVGDILHLLPCFYSLSFSFFLSFLLFDVPHPFMCVGRTSLRTLNTLILILKTSHSVCSYFWVFSASGAVGGFVFRLWGFFCCLLHVSCIF